MKDDEEWESRDHAKCKKEKKKKSRFILKEKYMPKIYHVPRSTSKEWRSSIHFINTESSPLNA